MYDALQSTSLVVVLKAYLSSDHVTAATGKTIAIQISKNGGAFGNPNAGATNATEIASGWYKVTLDTTDTATLGPLIVRGTATATDDVETTCNVIKATNGGLTALPDTACATNGSLLTAGTDTSQINPTSGAVPVTGDLTATMKTSVTTAATAATPTAAAVTGAVGSVTGNVGGNVTGSVGSVVGAVGSVTAPVTAGTVTDKTGYSLATPPLDAAGTRTALGLGSANLDTQLGTIASSASSAASSSSSAASSASTAATQASAAATSAADLQARTPATLVSGRMDASVGAFPLVIDGTKTGADVLSDLLAEATGAVAKTSNTYVYKRRDGTTTAFTITIATSSRTTS